MHTASAAALYPWPEESKSRAEALAVITRIGQALCRTKMCPESLFKVVDSNRDQKISQAEFNDMVTKFEKGVSAATLSIAFREFDRNSSGFIDLREFCAALERAGAPQATGLPVPSAAEVKRAELVREVKDLQVRLEDIDELARRKRRSLTGQDHDVPQRTWPDVSTWDTPALFSEQRRLIMELAAAEKSPSGANPANALMPSLPDPNSLAQVSSSPRATSSGAAGVAGGSASPSAGAASVASSGKADRPPIPSSASGYAAAPVPSAGQTKAASPKASSLTAGEAGSEQSAAADAHSLGAVTAAAAAAAAPIGVGTRVEYLSKSQGKWMPAMVLGFEAAAGTYQLDTKAAVYAHEVRMPEASAARHAPSVPTGSPSLAGISLLELDLNCGLEVNNKFNNSRMGPASDAHRDNVRNGTMEQVVKRLGLVAFGDDARCARSAPSTHKETTLFIDQSAVAAEGFAPAGGQNLLGRYDCIALRVCADYDSSWKFIQGNRPNFWVLHAAAVNVGENVRTSEIADFRKESLASLDEDKYLKAMLRIFDNVMLACTTLEAEHLVLFPFGMGAFLRNLHLLDATYNDERALQNLRCAIVAKLVQALESSLPTLRIHVCLVAGNLEARCNVDAFIRGFRAASQSIKDRTQMWSGADAFQLTHELASQSSKVILLNGANRRLLGNHWFEGGAKRAIDENLHRRSWMMSALAYLLNSYSCKRTFANRSPHELRDNVQWLGGKVYKT